MRRFSASALAACLASLCMAHGATLESADDIQASLFRRARSSSNKEVEVTDKGTTVQQQQPPVDRVQNLEDSNAAQDMDKSDGMGGIKALIRKRTDSGKVDKAEEAEAEEVENEAVEAETVDEEDETEESDSGKQEDAVSLGDCKNDNKWVAVNRRDGAFRKRYWPEESGGKGNQERNCDWVMLDRNPAKPRCHVIGCSSFDGDQCEAEERTTAAEKCPLACKPKCMRTLDKVIAGDCKNNKNWVAVRLVGDAYHKKTWQPKDGGKAEKNCEWVKMDKRWPNPRCNVWGCARFGKGKDNCASKEDRIIAAKGCPEDCFAHCNGKKEIGARGSLLPSTTQPAGKGRGGKKGKGKRRGGKRGKPRRGKRGSSDEDEIGYGDEDESASGDDESRYGGCSSTTVKFATESITCWEAKQNGYCNKQNSSGRRRADGIKMEKKCGGCCGGGGGPGDSGSGSSSGGPSGKSGSGSGSGGRSGKSGSGSSSGGRSGKSGSGSGGGGGNSGCKSGMVENPNRNVVLSSRSNDKDKCQEECEDMSGCVAFDFTEKGNSDACRGVSKIGSPRYGGGGADKRQFCIL